MANTGGTAAPSTVRVSGAAQALGAPKISQIKAQKTSPAGKVPGVGKKTPNLPRFQGSKNGKNAGRQGKAQAPGAPKPAARPSVFNPLEGTESGAELQKTARSEANEIAKTELTPLKEAATEIGQNQLGVSERYGHMAEATNSLLKSTGEQQEASAKTFENQQADNAIKAGQGVETAGQNARTLTGGALEPGVQAEINAEGQKVAQTGAAQQSFAANLGQSQNAEQSAIRSAAADRALEGQSRIASSYGKALATNEESQGRAVAKVGDDTAKIQNELGQKQFTDYATSQGLGLKTATLAQKGAETAAKDKLTERGQNLKTKETAERTKATERGQTLAQYRNAENNQTRIRGQNITQAHYTETDQIARQKAQAALKKGGLTTSEENKLGTEIGSAYETIRQLREQKLSPTQIRNVLSTGNLKANVGGKPSTLKFSRVSNPVLAQAAFELWDYHKVSPHTEATLKSLGLSIKPQELVGL
jgi:hypothetical protein